MDVVLPEVLVLRYSPFFGEASLEDVMPTYELLGGGNRLDRWVN
jgi:hypothetical protein